MVNHRDTRFCIALPLSLPTPTPESNISCLLQCCFTALWLLSSACDLPRRASFSLPPPQQSSPRPGWPLPWDLLSHGLRERGVTGSRSDSEQDPHPSASLIKQRSHSSNACLQASLFNVTLIIVTQNGHRYHFLKFRNVTARDRIASLWPEDYTDYSGQDKSGWIFALLPYSSY